MLWAFNLFFWTYEPREYPPVKPLITWDFQDSYALDLVRAITEGYDVAIHKSRDMAGTVTALAVLYWLWRTKGWDFRVGSRKEDYVDKKGDMDSLFEKLRFFHYRHPEWLWPDGFDARLHDHFCVLHNPEHGNSIVGEATSENFGVGGRKMAVLYDEFSRWKQDYKAWDAASDITPCRIALSTPSERGLGCKYADLVTKQQCKIIDLPWDLHPHKDEEWYEEQEARRTPQDLAINVNRDFVAAAGMVFNKDTIAAYLKQCVKGRAGRLSAKRPLAWLYESNGIYFVEDPAGELEIWRWPAKGNWIDRYCGAIDYAEGLPHGDWNVGGIRDRERNDRVAIWRSRTKDPAETSQAMALVGKFYHGAMLGPEVNGGYGYAGLKALRKVYNNIYVRRTYDKTTRESTNKWGWETTHENKKTMAVDVCHQLDRRKIGMWHRQTVVEMSTFVKDEKQRLAGSGDSWDDCVMCMMIEEQIHRALPPPKEIVRAPDDGWRDRTFKQGAEVYNIADIGT